VLGSGFGFFTPGPKGGMPPLGEILPDATALGNGLGSCFGEVLLEPVRELLLDPLGDVENGERATKDALVPPTAGMFGLVDLGKLPALLVLLCPELGIFLGCVPGDNECCA